LGRVYKPQSILFSRRSGIAYAEIRRRECEYCHPYSAVGLLSRLYVSSCADTGSTEYDIIGNRRVASGDQHRGLPSCTILPSSDHPRLNFVLWFGEKRDVGFKAILFRRNNTNNNNSLYGAVWS